MLLSLSPLLWLRSCFQRHLQVAGVNYAHFPPGVAGKWGSPESVPQTGMVRRSKLGESGTQKTMNVRAIRDQNLSILWGVCLDCGFLSKWWENHEEGMRVTPYSWPPKKHPLLPTVLPWEAQPSACLSGTGTVLPAWPLNFNKHLPQFPTGCVLRRLGGCFLTLGTSTR